MKFLSIKDLPFIGIIFVAVLIFFAPFFVSGKLPIPTDTLVGLYHPWRDFYSSRYERGVPFRNFLITDPIRQQIPWRKIATDMFKEGKIPWWNMYSFNGTPLIGNIQTGVFYPLNILFFLYSFPIAWSILIILQPLLAGIFLYIFLRFKNLSKYPALVASIAWGFCGFSIAWLTWGTIVHVSLWLPILLLAVEKLFLTQSFSSRLKWGSVLFFSLLSSFFAGHIQIFIYCLFVFMLYIFSFLLNSEAFQSEKKLNIRKNLFFISISFIFILFLIVASIQIRELITTINLSSRIIEENLIAKEGFFIPWQHLVQFIIPDFFGNPATLNYWGSWNYGELVGYVGIIPIILVCYAFYSKDKKQIYFWFLVLIISLLFSLPTPFAKLPYQLKIPLISSLQPTRLMILICLSLSILSAYGLQAMIEQRMSFKRFWPIIIVGSLFLGIYVYTTYVEKNTHDSQFSINLLISKRNTIFPIILFVISAFCFPLFRYKKLQSILLAVFIVCILFDLIRFGQKFTPFTTQEYFFPQTSIIKYLTSLPKPLRLLSLDDRIFPSNVGAFYGIEQVEGYDPIYSKYFEEFVVAHNRGKADLGTPYGFNRIVKPIYKNTTLFPLLGITHILSYDSLQDENLEFLMNEGHTYLYKIKNSLPRVYFVNKVFESNSDQEALQRLYNLGTNATQSAVISSHYNIHIDTISNNDELKIKEIESNKLVLETNTKQSGFIVISNNYYPNWKAKIDNEDTLILRTNVSFQGVVIPEGNHTIIINYGI